MTGCIGEDDLHELLSGSRALGDLPGVELHLASCASCSALLSTLLLEEKDSADCPHPSWGSLAGRSFGPYQLKEQIGAGATGEVYRAWDERLGRHVAIKVLSPRFAGEAGKLARLRAEGRAAAAIVHPHVVTVHDAGEVAGIPYVVSELIEGETLQSRIARGPLPPSLLLSLGLALARGLGAAHARGVIHRDLKPANLLLTRDGTLKIVDFGLAKQEAPLGADADATPSGVVLGTAGYLSPEQARGEPADARSDIFAAGAILYEMAYGEPAFGGATFAERLAKVLRDNPPQLSPAKLDNLYPVILRCLEKDPRDRFQSAQDLAWVLARLAGAGDRTDSIRSTGTPVRTSRRALLLGAGGAALASVIGYAAGRKWTFGQPAARPSYDQLTYRHGLVAGARFTSDGATAVYAAAWDGQPLSVYTVRLGGGGTRALPLPSADVLAVSSLGSLALSLDRRHVEGMHTSGTLAVSPLDGGEPRLVAEDVQEADFSPDGRALCLVRRGPNGFLMEMPQGEVIFEADGWLSYVRLSPAGDQAAVLLHPDVNDDRGSLLVVDLQTKKARSLAEGYHSVAGLAWAPGGKELWVTAAREAFNNALRAVSLDGRETILTETPGRLRLSDVDSKGRALCTHGSWRLRTLMRSSGASSEEDVSLSDVSYVGAISADGRVLALGEYGDTRMDAGVFVRTVGQGAPLRLGEGLPVEISPDGSVVLAVTDGIPSKVLVHSISRSSIGSVPLGAVESVTWAKLRGRDCVLAGAENGRPPRLWLVKEGATGPLPLTPEGLAGRFFVSPDGAMIAFLDDAGRLWAVPLDPPGEPRATPGSFPGEIACGFHRSGELFVQTAKIPVSVRRVDVATGRSTPHLEVSPPPLGRRGVDTFVLSASGDVYAYSYGQELTRLYMLSGLER